MRAGGRRVDAWARWGRSGRRRRRGVAFVSGRRGAENRWRRGPEAHSRVAGDAQVQGGAGGGAWVGRAAPPGALGLSLGRRAGMRAPRGGGGGGGGLGSGKDAIGSGKDARGCTGRKGGRRGAKARRIARRWRDTVSVRACMGVEGRGQWRPQGRAPLI
ncbi:MAG: hypothetical protein J3K34DRAFT_279326 [Monoraphidium minutum]|nr:MAG: hypothetical protein J3K34DRAFT_279326 [Monoraphidium minutum]